VAFSLTQRAGAHAFAAAVAVLLCTSAAQAGDAPRPSASASAPDFKWIAGKLPSDVASDSRFRAAFNEMRPNEWRRIVERLGVGDASGVTLQNGYYFAEACKPHACGTDYAAFAIDAATGKGDVMYRATVDEASGKSITRSFAWPELPIAATPLAAWAKSKGL
jgi:hypothetical protein